MRWKSVIAGIAVLIAGLAVVQAAAPPGAPTVNDEEAWVNLPMDKDKIHAGQIAVRESPPRDGVKTYGVIAGFIVDAGIQQAYTLIRATEKQIDYTKLILEIKINERGKNYEKVQVRIKFMGRPWTYNNIRHWDDAKFKIWWALDPDKQSDFKQLDGYYYFYYIDDSHTLVRYRSDLVFKEFIPLAIQQVVIRQDMPHGLEDVRKFINSGGTYRVQR